LRAIVPAGGVHEAIAILVALAEGFEVAVLVLAGSIADFRGAGMALPVVVVTIIAAALPGLLAVAILVRILAARGDAALALRIAGFIGAADEDRMFELARRVVRIGVESGRAIEELPQGEYSQAEIGGILSGIARAVLPGAASSVLGAITGQANAAPVPGSPAPRLHAWR
jgi:hypothetical protein